MRLMTVARAGRPEHYSRALVTRSSKPWSGRVPKATPVQLTAARSLIAVCIRTGEPLAGRSQLIIKHRVCQRIMPK